MSPQAPATSARPAYSEVMEDWDPISAGLGLTASDVLVSVASAGDNVFNALLEGPARVHAVDIAPAEIALCRLKADAIRRLEWAEFSQLVGASEVQADTRQRVLDRLDVELVEALAPDAGAREAVATGGLAEFGELPRFLAPLRAGLTTIVGAVDLNALLTEGDRDCRRVLFDRLLNTSAVRRFFASALTRETIADTFIPAAAWDRMAEPDFGEFYMRVLEHLIVDLEPADNPFLHRIWLGRFVDSERVPPYLRSANFARLTEALQRVEWHVNDLGDFLGSLPDRSVDAFNVSNVLDWCDEAQHRRIWAEADRVARPGARLFLRSFLRSRPVPHGQTPAWTRSEVRDARAAQADRVGYFSRYETWTRSTD